MAALSANQIRVVVGVDDLDQATRNAAFEGLVLCRYGTFDGILAKAMSDPGYHYLHCDLLDRNGLTTVTLSVRSPFAEQYEKILLKGAHVRVENFGVKEKSKKGFEKGDMPIIMTVELTTILSSIPPFQPPVVPYFFHTHSIREFRTQSLYQWASTTLAVIVIGVKGDMSRKIGEKSAYGEKQLMVADGEGEFDHDVISIGGHLKTEYELLVDAFNVGQCPIAFIKNITATTKRD